VLDTRVVRRVFPLSRYAWNGWTFHVHTNGHNVKSWLLALICGLVGQAAAGCVLTLHSGMAPAYLNSSWWKRSLARLVCGLYYRVIAVSPAIRDVLPGPSEVLPACLPVDRATTTFDLQTTAWLVLHRPLLSTALFFRPEYGFEVLTAAVDRLRQTYPELGCIVMGEGRTQAAPESPLLFAGDVDHRTCLALIARSDAFVRPTLEDGDSISVREALALGVPVVASRVGMRPEGTILFRPGDAEDLAEKLEVALAADRRQPSPVHGCLERLMEIYEEAPRKTGRYDAARAGA
jgi:glycosyltransferase involved in cell wall biosynthesis